MKIKGIVLLTAACLCGFSLSVFGEENIIVMGYKDESKPPLIGEVDDDTGAYKELFSKAAEIIGCQLKIVRIPKNRLYHMLEKGDIDFYPGSSFSEERSAYLCFLKNGFQTKEVLLTRKDANDIKDISDVSGTLLADLGGSKSNFGAKYKNIKVTEVSSLGFEQAINMIRRGRADFYIADIEEVEYYQKYRGLKDYAEIGVKIHYNTFGDFMPMYMGFAMNSKLFKGKDNPQYDKGKPLDYENTPKTVAEDCIAYQFYGALMQLKERGETQKIYHKYFK